MIFKKVTFWSFFACVFLVLISGCAKKEKVNELVVWHWMSDRQDAFEELAQVFEEETGIKVHFEVFFPPDVYMQKIQAAAAANDLPDLFGILGEKKIFADFIEAGYIGDISPFMEENEEEWKKRFIDITLRVNSFEKDNIYGVKAGVYAVPIDLMSIQFLYNIDLLQKAGGDPSKPPSTWNEFVSIAKRAKEELGVNGFVCGWGEPWLIYCLVTDYAFNTMGEEKFFATIRGELSYTDQAWVDIFSLFKALKDSNLLAPGIVTMSNKEAEQLFASNQAVFSFNGSWGMNTYSQMNPDLQYDTMLPPVPGENFPVKIWGGAGSSFVVNNNCLMKNEAMSFLKWLTEKKQQIFLMEHTRNLPSVKMEGQKIEKGLARFFKHMGSATHPNLWRVNEHPRVLEAINTGVQKIIIGQNTPEEVAAEVQKTKERTQQK